MKRLLAGVGKLLWSLVPVALFLIAWEIASRNLGSRMPLLPPPSACASALLKWAREDDLLKDLMASGKLLLFGLLCGGVTGVIVGLVTGRGRILAFWLVPIIRLFRPLPPVALVPLFIVLMGIGDRAKIFSISFAVFFPVWLNTFTGARQTPQRLLWSASTLTRSRWRIFWRIVVPASLPHIVTGIRQGISLGFVMVFVSELMGAEAGIGYKISIYQLAYRMDAMIAALALLGAGGAFADWAFTALMYRLFPYLRLLDHRTESTRSESDPVKRFRIGKLQTAYQQRTASERVDSIQPISRDASSPALLARGESLSEKVLP